jgi:hypothetical protein
MLKGFTVPKSPFGQAALTSPPPWHYAGDAVGVEYWTDPDATLPNGLSRDPKSNGRAIMMFLDWQFTAQDDEYLEPARYQYREALILVDGVYRDLPVMWCPYIYVDNDAALACGWTRGFQKKWAAFFRRAPLRPRAHLRRPLRPAAGLAPAFRQMASVLRKPASPCRGRSKTEYLSSADRRSCCNTFRDWRPATRISRAVNELAISITDNLIVAGAWIGKGAQLSGSQWQRTRRARAEQDRVRVSYSLSYSVSDLKSLEGSGS